MSAWRLAVLVAVSIALTPLLLGTLGAPGLIVYFALWLVATPLVLPRLRTALRREWAGALFVLATAASADYLDATLALEQRISVAIVLTSLVYLVQRRASDVLRSPVLLLFALFLAQQLVSALVFGTDDVAHVATNRFSVVACLAAGAVMVRRPDGDRLLACLVILGALVSVPLMIHEALDGSLVLFPALVSDIGLKPSGRAAGLFVNPNGAGMAISFAAAFTLGLRACGQLGRGATALILAVAAVGLLACASRGALAVVALVALVGWFLEAARRSGRRPWARLGLVALTLAAIYPALQSGAPALAGKLDRLGFENVDRLAEVVGALTGSPDELIDDDSHRLSLVEQSLPMIAEKPWLGWGTYNFEVIDDRGAHNQLLEVLGENGIVGLTIYVAFLLALARAVLRAPKALRTPALLVAAAWLLHHFDCHNLVDYRNGMLPIAYACGLGFVRRARVDRAADCAVAVAV